MKENRRIRRGLLALCALIFGVQAWHYAPYLLDDAYISLRYSLHLTEGHGLVFNPGERVEGYTNFLWVLLGSVVIALGGVDPMTALKCSSLVATGVLAIAVTRLERQLVPRPGAVPALALLLPLESFAYCSTTGLETMAFSALFALAFSVGLAERPGSGRRTLAPALFLLLAMLRPEGVLCFALALLAYLLVDALEGRGLALKPRIRDGLLFSAAFVPFLAWRYAYYGDIVPNTFHAKVTGGSEQYLNGFINLGTWALAHPLLAGALGLPLALALPGTRSWWLHRPRLLATGAMLLAYVAYLVSVGGDFMPFFRFYLPVTAFAAVTASAYLATWIDRPGRWLAGLLLVHVVANQWTDQPYRAFVADRTTVVGREVGMHLAATRPPESLLAVNTAGSLPYFSGLRTIDMLGLTDPVIAHTEIYVTSTRWAAHRRGNGAYVLGRRPDVVVWYNAGGSREPHYLGDHQLADEAAFRFFYQLRPLRLLEEEGGPEEGRELATFAGYPFGRSETPQLAPDLATRFESEALPYPRTRAYSAPITAQIFEQRREHRRFWDLHETTGGALPAFLDGVTAAWTRDAAVRPPADPAARRDVEAMCAAALREVEAGRMAHAREILSAAVARNAQARSPLVYQYVANIAIMDRDLFLAVQAQAEALRFDPGNRLYRQNLEHLLTVPWKRFRARETG